uniref:Leucine rich repeat containing 56 n=1 Tax=Erpetoichthys calabaricus TaxID=27687 RepID=A0A8C4RGD1_ERPCA
MFIYFYFYLCYFVCFFFLLFYYCKALWPQHSYQQWSEALSRLLSIMENPLHPLNSISRQKSSFSMLLLENQVLAKTDDLTQVTFLEMCVDTRENSLGNFGTYLPSLVQMKLNNSVIASVRDLGTTLSHLEVLWMVRCCLSDLDGIPSFCSLKELYLAYNDISDLSQVSMLDHLVILDLEGNNIEDIIQVQYLGLCSKLSVLTLEGNPVCLTPRPGATEVGYNYRATVKDLIPQLSVLDDLPADDITPSACRQANEDWKTIKDLIKDSSLLEDDVTSGKNILFMFLASKITHIPGTTILSQVRH